MTEPKINYLVTKSNQAIINGVNQIYQHQIGIKYFEHHEIAMDTMDLYVTGKLMIKEPKIVIQYLITDQIDLPQLSPDLADYDIGDNDLFYQQNTKSVDKIIAMLHRHLHDGYNWPNLGFQLTNVQIKTKLKAGD